LIDGGSTDGTVAVLRAYDPWITAWVSEPNSGQVDAINKGLRQASGDVLMYLNSDDILMPGALLTFARTWRETGALWLSGDANYMAVDGTPVRDLIPVENWDNSDVIRHLILNPLLVAVQVSNTFARGYYVRFGLYDPQYDLCFDVEFGLRGLLAGVRPHILHTHLASARQHPDAKTTLQAGEHGFQRETCTILQGLDLGGDAALEAARVEALANFSRLTSWRAIEVKLVCGDRWELIKRAFAELARSPSLILCRPFWGLVCRGLMPEGIGLRSS
jgi:glycosyltransferase involved in cell wall biosynthesis